MSAALLPSIHAQALLTAWLRVRLDLVPRSALTEAADQIITALEIPSDLLFEISLAQSSPLAHLTRSLTTLTAGADHVLACYTIVRDERARIASGERQWYPFFDALRRVLDDAPGPNRFSEAARAALVFYETVDCESPDPAMRADAESLGRDYLLRLIDRTVPTDFTEGAAEIDVFAATNALYEGRVPS